MKNLKTVFLVLMGLLCSFDVSAFKVDGFEYDFTADGKGVKVTLWNGRQPYWGEEGHYSGDLVIPAEIVYNGQTYPVTEIGYWAFMNCFSLTSIEIPTSVTFIDYGAFRDCTSLDNVEIPSSITSISRQAFLGCTSLTSINIPTSVTSIAEEAFSGCTSLATINIPNTVTSIGNRVFAACMGMTHIEIPKSVISIGEAILFNCPSLTSIKVDPENKIYDSRENCNALIESASNTLFMGCSKTVIPNSVTSIGDEAFQMCRSLTSIEIPNSVTSIGNFAFNGCDSLISIEIPNSVTSIGKRALFDWRSLASITIQNLNSAINDEHHLMLPLHSFKTARGSISNPEVLTTDEYGVIKILGPGIADITITGTDWYDQPITKVCKVIVGGACANISDAGYATFSTPSDYQVPGELQAGIVEVKDNRANVTLLDPTTSCYPSDEAVILKGAPGEYFLPTPMEKTVLEKNANNDLKAAHNSGQINAEAGNELFVLSNGNSGLGFYYQMGCPDGSYVKDLKGKAYLELSKATLMGLKSLHLYDGEVTGIDEVETENGGDAVVYSLSGVRMNQSVNQLPKGVYIVNGKKVMVK